MILDSYSISSICFCVLDFFSNAPSALIIDDKASIALGYGEVDFEGLKQDKPQPGTFVFTNTGDAPFVLTNVTFSCGCTTPDWPRGPVKPGKIGEIKVTYDAQHTGRFIKTIRVEGNVAGGFITLSIKGQVQSNEFEQSDQEP